MRFDVDLEAEAAEAVLDRIDDAQLEGGELPETSDNEAQPIIADASAFSVHVEVDPSEDDRYLIDPEDENQDLVCELVEVFNTRDSEACQELLTTQARCEGLGSGPACHELEMLWDSRPGLTMTSARLEHEIVGALWEVGLDGAWWLVGMCAVDAANGRIRKLTFTDETDVLDEIDAIAPEGTVEGASWSEWEDGVLLDA